MSVFSDLKKDLFREGLSKESFEAYFYRLPDDIGVSWFRDGNFIVGKVSAKDREFMTQGRSVEEFIDMVNDSIYTVFDIPKNYLDVMKKTKSYNLPAEEKKKLEDISVKKSSLLFRKDDKVLQTV